MGHSTGITANVSLHGAKTVGSQLSAFVEEGDSQARVVLSEDAERAGERGQGVLLGERSDHVAEGADSDRREEVRGQLAKPAQRERSGERRGRGERRGGEGVELVEEQRVAELVVELEKGEEVRVRRRVRKDVRAELRLEALQVQAVELRAVRRRQHPTPQTVETGKHPGLVLLFGAGEDVAGELHHGQAAVDVRQKGVEKLPSAPAEQTGAARVRQRGQSQAFGAERRVAASVAGAFSEGPQEGKRKSTLSRRFRPTPDDDEEFSGDASCFGLFRSLGLTDPPQPDLLRSASEFLRGEWIPKNPF